MQELSTMLIFCRNELKQMLFSLPKKNWGRGRLDFRITVNVVKSESVLKEMLELTKNCSKA